MVSVRFHRRWIFTEPALLTFVIPRKIYCSRPSTKGFYTKMIVGIPCQCALPAPDSKIPCAKVMDAGMPYCFSCSKAICLYWEI